MNRYVPVLLLLSLFANFALAVASPADVLKDYVKPGEALTTRQIDAEFGSFTVAVINGRDSILVSNADSSLITDPSLIYSALKYEYLSQSGVSVDSERLIETMQHFNASREPREEDCKRSIGVDRFPCTDFASCRYACLSVPLCRGLFEGQGDNFIYAIQNWRDASSKIDKGVSDFTDACSQIKDNPVMAKSASEYLDSLEMRANDVQANKLFVPVISGGFEFCYQINFSFGDINDARSDLAGINQVLAKLPDVEKNSSIIAGITEQRIKDKLANDVVYQYQETFAKVSSNFTKTREEINSVLAKVSSESLSANLSALESIRDDMGRLGEAMNYSGAVSVGDSYFALAKSALQYAGRLSFSHSSLVLRRDALGSRLDADRNISSLGSYFTSEFGKISATLASLSASLSPPVQEQSLEPLSSNFTALSGRLAALEGKAAVALELLNRIGSSEESLANFTSKALQYQQVYNYELINSSLNSARNSTLSGDSSQAEELLKKAADSISALESELDAKIPAIEKAKQDNDDANGYMSLRRGASFLFLGADFSGAEGLCKKALDSVYSDPSQSMEYSKQCRGAVDSSLQMLEYQKYGLIILFIVLLYLLYWWARKREWSFVIG